MAISTSLKIASVAIGAGGIITGSAVGIHNYLSKSNEEGKKEDSTLSSERTTSTTAVTAKKIKSLLGAGNRLLKKESQDTEQWGQKWNAFKSAYSSKDPSEIHSSWRFNNWNASKLLPDVQEEFQNKCINNSEDSVEQETDPRVIAIKTYCTTTQ